MEDVYILIAEDDSDDRFLLQSAFEENGFTDHLHFVENGIELIDYLNDVAGNIVANLPRFVMLDLNMPKKDGREVLKELRSNPQFSAIPLIVFSTTNNEMEMKRCYDLGASRYITKPNSYESLKKTVAEVRNTWINAHGLF